MAEPEGKKPNLTLQRVLIVLAVLVVLAMAGGNIVNSLSVWNEQDEAPPAPAATPAAP